MKKFLTIIIILALLGLGAYYLFFNQPTTPQNQNSENSDENSLNNATTTEETNTSGAKTYETNLGKSAGGRDIPIYQFGEGSTEILFIGGIHGGYSWNTTLLAQETLAYFEENPEIIPSNVKVTVIPVLNPDGLSKVLGDSSLSDLSSNPPKLEDTIIGRFNGDNVDLNRNFDCDWQTEGTWQNKAVSGGDEVFSEPEARAIKNYIENENPKAVVVWYSASGGVFSSNCHNGILEETRALTNTYANASGYPAYDEFSSYEVTGDMVNWLAKKNIPAISVLLTDHNNTEWTKNKAGIEAILNYYAE